MNRFKNITHVIAGVLATAVGGILTFAATPAGQAIMAQYPKLSAFVALLVTVGTILGVYHNPKEPRPLGN